MESISLKEIVENLGLEVRTCPEKIETTKVSGGYVSDLMSDVIANSNERDIWVTIQAHQNIVAIATLKELAGVIITNGKQPDPETIERATKENVPILLSKMTSFDVVGKLYEMGLRSSKYTEAK